MKTLTAEILVQAARADVDGLLDVAKNYPVPRAPNTGTSATGYGQTFDTFVGILPQPRRFMRFGFTLADPAHLPPHSQGTAMAKSSSFDDAKTDAIPGAALGAAGGALYGALKDHGPGQSRLNDALFYGLVGTAGGGALSAGGGYASRQLANRRLQDVDQDTLRASQAAGQFGGERPMAQASSDILRTLAPAAADPGTWGYRLHRAVNQSRDRLNQGISEVDGQPGPVRSHELPLTDPPKLGAASESKPAPSVVLYRGMRTPPAVHNSAEYQQAVMRSLERPGYTNYERLRAAARSAREIYTPSLAHAKQYAGPGGWISELHVPQQDVHAFHVVPLRTDGAGRSLSFEIAQAALQDRLAAGTWRHSTRRIETDMPDADKDPVLVGLPGTKTSAELVRRRVEVIPMDYTGRVLVGELAGVPGVVVVPGGGVKTHEALSVAAARELYEETGLRPTALLRLNKDAVSIPTPSKGPGIGSNYEETYFYLGMVVPESQQDAPGPGPLTKMRWVDPATAIRLCGPSRAADPWGANRALRAQAICHAHEQFETHFQGDLPVTSTKTALAWDDTDGWLVYTSDGEHVLGRHASYEDAVVHGQWLGAVREVCTKTAGQIMSNLWSAAKNFYNSPRLHHAAYNASNSMLQGSQLAAVDDTMGIVGNLVNVKDTWNDWKGLLTPRDVLQAAGKTAPLGAGRAEARSIMTAPQRAVDTVYDVGRYGSELANNVTREMRAMPVSHNSVVGWRGTPVPLHPQVEPGGRLSPRPQGLLNRVAAGARALMPSWPVKGAVPPPIAPSLASASHWGDGKLAYEIAEESELLEKDAFLGATFSLGAKGVGRLAKPLAAKLPAGVNRAVASGVAKTEKGLGLVDNVMGSSHAGMDMARRSSLSNMGY